MPRLSKSATALVALTLFAAGTADRAVSRPAGDHDGGARNRSCFWPSQVSGFSDATDRQLLVHTGPNEAYLFKTFGPCPEMDFSQAIGFDVSPAGSMICSGLDVTLIVPSSIGQQRCPVRMIRKMTDAEAKRLSR